MSLFLRISSFSLIIGSLWTQCVAQTKLDPNNPVYSAFYTVEQATEFPKDEVPVYEKAPGAVLLSTNFANTLGSWTTSGSNGAVWQHDDDGPSGQFSVAANEIIASQSINNGFAIFDADLSNPGPGPWQARSGALVSPAFSMTGVTSAFVEFYQKYRFCCDASFFPKLEVSNNDFLTFATFDARIPNVGSGIISPTEFSKINITAFLDTATDLSAVKIRFNFQGTSQATHYYWQIDDVKVKEAFLYDLNIQSFKMGMGQMQLPYYFMPITQVSPVTFYGSVLNEGSLEGENVHLEVNLDQGGGSTTSDSVLLQPLESASFSTYTLTPPSVWNFYTVTYDFVQDSVEGYPIDNSSTEILSVFDHLYSIDKNEASGYISNVSTQVGQPFKIGNVMEVLQDDVIDSMHIIITGTQSNIDQQIYGELRKKVNGSWQLIESTQPVWITWDNYTQSIGLRFWNIVNVQAGDTLLVLACHVGGGTGPDVRFKLAQSVEPGIVQGYTADGTLFSLNDPHALMIRLNMNALVGLDENALTDLTVYPNPFNDELYIKDVEGDGTLIVHDLNGRELFSEKIDHGADACIKTGLWSPGIYTIRYFNGASYLNKKVVKL
ncbi:MAG: T9SS type A sorting domain-containing protein [Flavobacteriales bacterium]